jgi:phosphoribosylaminoimidazole synthetase
LEKEGTLSMKYRVNIDKGAALVNYIKSISSLGKGGFSAALKTPSGDDLYITMDGVGTKLLLAKQEKKFKTIGYDLVAMVANDILVAGGIPKYLVDYYGTGKLKLNKAKQVITSIVHACNENNITLVGGETAEMPDLYAKGDIDLVATAIGFQPENPFDPRPISAGDLIYGVKSSGFHSNGYTLIRDALATFNRPGEEEKQFRDFLVNYCLRPTTIYTELFEKYRTEMKAAAHITGGGLYNNSERMLDDKHHIVWTPNNIAFMVPEPMQLVCERAEIDTEEAYKTFNMGIGITFISSNETLPFTKIGRIYKT